MLGPVLCWPIWRHGSAQVLTRRCGAVWEFGNPQFLQLLVLLIFKQGKLKGMSISLTGDCLGFPCLRRCAGKISGAWLSPLRDMPQGDVGAREFLAPLASMLEPILCHPMLHVEPWVSVVPSREAWSSAGWVPAWRHGLLGIPCLLCCSTSFCWDPCWPVPHPDGQITVGPRKEQGSKGD